MFTFQDTKGNTYKVAFSYERKTVPARAGNPKSKDHLRPERSICVITDLDGNVVAQGSVKPHPKTHFTYEGGRKWALRRAFESCALSKADRACAWKELRKGKE